MNGESSETESLIPPFDWQQHVVNPWSADGGIFDTVWIVLMAVCVITTCGLVGNYLILRRMALVGDAMERARAYQEEQARAAAEARQEAIEPIREAQAAEKKADAWLEAGRRTLEEYGELEELMTGWTALPESATTLRSIVEQATQHMEDVVRADDPKDIRRIGAETRRAA